MSLPLQFTVQPWKGFFCQEGRGSAVLGRTARRAMLAAYMFFCCCFSLWRGRGTYEPMCLLSSHYKLLTYRTYFPWFRRKLPKGHQIFQTVKFQEKDKTAEVFCPSSLCHDICFQTFLTSFLSFSSPSSRASQQEGMSYIAYHIMGQRSPSQHSPKSALGLKAR